MGSSPHQSENTLSGLEVLFWLLCLPSNRCGSVNKSTTSLDHPSSTENASKKLNFQKKYQKNNKTFTQYIEFITTHFYILYLSTTIFTPSIKYNNILRTRSNHTK